MPLFFDRKRFRRVCVSTKTLASPMLLNAVFCLHRSNRFHRFDLLKTPLKTAFEILSIPGLTTINQLFHFSLLKSLMCLSVCDLLTMIAYWHDLLMSVAERTDTSEVSELQSVSLANHIITCKFKVQKRRCRKIRCFNRVAKYCIF